MDPVEILVVQVLAALAWVMRFEKRMDAIEERVADLSHIVRRDDLPHDLSGPH